MLERIKDFLMDDTCFYATLLLLIAFSSFGLGRWSVLDAGVNTQTASVALQRYASDETSVKNVQGTEEENPNTQSSEALSGVYVGSKNGSKYHLPWCPGAKQIKKENEIWFQTKEEAQNAGYTPAANCKGM